MADEPANLGPLLTAAIGTLEKGRRGPAFLSLALEDADSTVSGTLPIVATIDPEPPRPGEHWKKYSARIRHRLEPIQEFMEGVMGVDVDLLLAGNALQSRATPDQIQKLKQHKGIRYLELDPLVQLASMDDACADVGLPQFRPGHPNFTGSGVRVAVLDSGIDLAHPYLQVVDSVETCGESVDIPGSHGTHCAGSIASRDSTFPGVASDAELINVKVMRADNAGRHTWITRGIDEALDRDARILSLSLGFNHLPIWSEDGHGWSCSDGRCPLCTAVDNAVALDDVVVVVAAANEHERAESLRSSGYGNTFDSEIACPGQARQALTVGAITKRTYFPAASSSRGPTSFGTSKPDVVACGVNITSTVPVPRQSNGTPVSNPSRSELFGRKSGTSMATPIVAGVAAILVQGYQRASISWTAASVRQALQRCAVLPTNLPPNVGGHGRIDISGLRWDTGTNEWERI